MVNTSVGALAKFFEAAKSEIFVNFDEVKNAILAEIQSNFDQKKLELQSQIHTKVLEQLSVIQKNGESLENMSEAHKKFLENLFLSEMEKLRATIWKILHENVAQFVREVIQRQIDENLDGGYMHVNKAFVRIVVKRF